VAIPRGRIVKRKDQLPHWQAGGSAYHIDFNCRPFDLSAGEREIVIEIVRKGDELFFDLLLGCVMPDHVHLLLRPREEVPDHFHDLARIRKGIKGASARLINLRRKRCGPFWQDEGYDRIIRNHAEYGETFTYILNNPVAAGLCASPEDYPFMILARDELRW